MRLSSGLSLIVAVAFGGLAVFVVRGVLLGAASGTATRSVVVAAGPIAIGSPLTAENLREVAWPAAETLAGSFSSVNEVVRDGRRLALVRLSPSEPILAAKVTAPNQRATLSTQIDEGMRAVTVRVDEVRGVAGFVLPGDRVDVILTRGEDGGVGASAYADMLLQSAKVLAVDQLANDRQDRPAVARAVTLELTLLDAQKVVLAQGIGRLSLVLRQSGEAESGPALRVTASELGLADTPRDRFAEIDKRFDAITKALEASRAQNDPAANRRLSELENRMSEIGRQSAPVPPPVPTPAAAPAPSTNRIVKVTRNGGKTEQYTVTAER